jgi:hypothetical protein
MTTTTRIRPDSAAAPRLKTRLRGRQQGAADTCVSSFIEGYRRVSVYMATGTGKTLVALYIVQETAPEGVCLVLVPSLRLLEQTAKAWHREGRPGRYLGVCSSDNPADPYLVGILTMVDTGEELAWQAADTQGNRSTCSAPTTPWTKSSKPTATSTCPAGTSWSPTKPTAPPATTTNRGPASTTTTNCPPATAST